jgi:hypothetical protein
MPEGALFHHSFNCWLPFTYTVVFNPHYDLSSYEVNRAIFGLTSRTTSHVIPFT